MTSEENLALQRIALNQAVGECVSAWAGVEVKIAAIFIGCLGVELVIADAILATPRSFDVRMRIVHNVLSIRLTDNQLLHDWGLIYNHLCKMGSKRNEVAHALTLTVDQKTVMLEPYFVLSKVGKNISVSDVQETTASFIELENSLWWFESKLIPTPKTPLSIPERPLPDLVLRLRKENAQNREEQRARKKS